MKYKTTKPSKTRKLIVDVARRLFAAHGKANVTMNDIAIESGKGRRTIYTYFSNKDEVYLAVIENELDHLIERLEIVMNRDLTPDRKLEEYIFTRFEAVKEAIERNGSLRADFFRNIYEVQVPNTIFQPKNRPTFQI
jgi:AcrR family transcriptional regulator